MLDRQLDPNEAPYFLLVLVTVVALLALIVWWVRRRPRVSFGHQVDALRRHLIAAAVASGAPPESVRVVSEPGGVRLYAPVPRREGLEWQVRVAPEGHGVRTTLAWRQLAAPILVRVRPELLAHRLDKALGATLDVEVGARDFDRAFLVDAAPADVARRVLGAELRAALLALPRDDEQPTLVVAPCPDGVQVTLTWFGASPDPGLLLSGAADLARACGELREGVDVAAGPFRGAPEGNVDAQARGASLRALARARRRFAVVAGAILAAAAALFYALVTRLA